MAQPRQPEFWLASLRGPTLAQCWQNLLIMQPIVMFAQCWQNLPTMRPPANIGPMAECYLGTSLTGGPPLAAISQQMLWFGYLCLYLCLYIYMF